MDTEVETITVQFADARGGLFRMGSFPVPKGASGVEINRLAATALHMLAWELETRGGGDPRETYRTVKAGIYTWFEVAPDQFIAASDRQTAIRTFKTYGAQSVLTEKDLRQRFADYQEVPYP